MQSSVASTSSEQRRSVTKLPSLNEVSEALWDKVIAGNVKGPFRLTAAIGSRMAADSGGSILNVSSSRRSARTRTSCPTPQRKRD